MITDTVLLIWYFLAVGVVSNLPMGTGFPSSIDTAVSNVAGYFHVFDDIFPGTTVFDVLAFLLTVQIALFVFWMARLFAGFIRGN